MIEGFRWDSQLPSSPQKEYGYRNGQMLIVAQTSPLEVRWLVTDHLGTPRMNIRGTGSDGGSLTSVARHDYLPFGEELIVGIRRNGSIGQYGYEPPPDGVRQKFTGYERDTETALDYAQARYHSSVQGRFTSPDLPFADQYEHDPQSWNLYAYVRNNPCSNNDPTGRNTCYFRKDGSKIGCEGDTRIKIATGEGQGTITRTDKEGKTERLSLDDVKAVTYASTATNHTAELAFEMNRYAPALNRFGAVGGSIALGVVGLPVAGLAGGGTATLGLMTGEIAGPYGTTSVAVLQSLASSGGPTVEIVTNLTQSPIAGRALHTAIGGSETLANAAGAVRGAGHLFRAKIPRALLEELKRVGLAEVKTTSMKGVTGTEVKFAPAVTKFIVQLFK